MSRNFSSVLEQKFFPRVRKPNRYSGQELNRICKPRPELRWALAFPDLYEIGMSHLGLRLLYHRVNHALAEVSAERVYLPEEDAAALMRHEKIPLYTLESKTPLGEVDVVGVNLSCEMAMPGVLELLDLGRIPIYSKDRGEHDPIVIAGGPVVYNPEPVADFLDAVVVGDGEDVIVEISRAMLSAKRAGLSRAAKLDRLARIDGIYVPGRYNLRTDGDGRPLPVAPEDTDVAPVVHGRTVTELRPEFYPQKPLVPLVEIIHDRLSVEVMRGCTRGCRFCHAGMVYRPVRERPAREVIDQVVANIDSTGYEEISLLSLSTSDYGPLPQLIDGLREALRGKGVSLAFPSLRPDSFTREMAREWPEGRKGSLTFAPEAGTQRLRDMINKNSRECDLLRAVEIAFREGYTGIKLYFMIGLPGETRKDIDGIFDLAEGVARLRTRGGQKVTVSVSPFAPKAHTPYQWFGQESTDQMREKLSYLRRRFGKSSVRFTGHDPDRALFESALARGDRRLSRVIERVWRCGGVLESWSDRFDSGRWYEAFREEGLDPREFVRARMPGGDIPPWSHISKGIEERFLHLEWKKSQKRKATPDCRDGRCVGCGLTDFIPPEQDVCNSYAGSREVPGAKIRSELMVDVAVTARLRYRRGEEMRWTGHLDMVRLWDRLLRRANLPVAFTRGFHPHPRLGFAPPLPVGLLSEDEYIDIDLARPLAADELVDGLKDVMPEGMEPLEVVTMTGRPAALSAEIGQIEYAFRAGGSGEFAARLKKWLDRETYVVERRRGDKRRTVDLRPFVESVNHEPDGSWRLRLRMENGSTARLDELGNAWGIHGPGLGDRAVRLAMYVRHQGLWCRPIEALDGVITRSSRRTRG